MNDTKPELMIPNAIDTDYAGVLPWEDPEECAALYSLLCADLVPVGRSESVLVERLAWIAWRRQRIQLAERALHLTEISQHMGREDGRRVARQGLVMEDIKQPAIAAKEAVVSSRPGRDVQDAAEVAAEDADLKKAIAILEKSSTKAAIDAALACLREDTIEWWNNVLEDEGEGDDIAARAARLLSFLTGSVQNVLDEMTLAIRQRPDVRLQAWGKSLDPFRLMKLLLLDGELDRQFERSLKLLFTLQARRSAGPEGRSDAA